MKNYFIKQLLPLFATTALIIPLTTSCSEDENDEPDIEITWPGKGQYGADNQSDKKSRTVTSHYEPTDGQDHRSSANFSTSGMDGGTYIQWTVNDGISFDIMEDRPRKSDPTFAHSIVNGARTKYEGDWVNNPNLYIANPKGAGGKDFVVTYTIVSDDNTLCISSVAPHLSGQDHRASDNFRFDSGCYRIECADGISFSIMEDISGGADKTIYTNIKNGAIISDVEGVDNLYIADVAGTDHAVLIKLVPYTTEWMTFLDDSLQLYSLSIPGTHDTGTYTIGPGIAKCQNFGIAAQLDHGIRCFDIRLDGSLKLCHGSGITYTNLGITFDQVLGEFNNWLASHPRECILMMVKAESDETHMRESIKSYFASNSDKTANILRGESFPKLGAARGKIVLMRRFATPDGEDDSNWGIDIGAGWPDDATGTYAGDNFNSYIEDRFFDIDEAIHDTGEKKKAVEAAIKDANTDTFSDYFFIVYNSVAGRLDHTPWDYTWGGGPILEISPEMSTALSDILKTMEDNHAMKFRTGTVMMDFYNKHGNDDDKHLVQRIINSNFGEKKINY